MLGRRTAFWVAVGGVSILSNFLLEVAAAKFPQIGLQRLVHFTHRGGGA